MKTNHVWLLAFDMRTCICYTENSNHRPALHLASLAYRWPFGPPGPALARARPGPLLAVPCLARPNIKSGRAVPAHGLYQRPKHGPAGLFRARPARWSPTLQPRLGRLKPIVQNTSHSTPNLTSNSKKRSQITASHTQRHI